MQEAIGSGVLHIADLSSSGGYIDIGIALWVCSQDAGKGEWARMRILQMSRQMIEECRDNKNLDKRSIAVRR